jgi:hypothetical protein
VKLAGTTLSGLRGAPDLLVLGSTVVALANIFIPLRTYLSEIISQYD